MSTAAATAIAGALWKGFRWILQRIGRWVARDLVDYGITALIGYMRVRIGVFEKRLKRARRKRRKFWLQGRIFRWTKALNWLRAHSKRIRLKTLDAFDVLAKQVPERSPWEKYAA